MKNKAFIVFMIGCFLGTEFADAKIGTRMRKSRRFASVPAATAVLSWSPTGSTDDFMTNSPQTFTLTNTGSVAATNLSFTAPMIPDKGSYITSSNTFIVTSTTCGSSLAPGNSCTVDLEYFTCNDQCTYVLLVICNGTVQAMADSGVTANLNPLYYNYGEI